MTLIAPRVMSSINNSTKCRGYDTRYGYRKAEDSRLPLSLALEGIDS